MWPTRCASSCRGGGGCRARCSRCGGAARPAARCGPRIHAPGCHSRHGSRCDAAGDRCSWSQAAALGLCLLGVSGFFSRFFWVMLLVDTSSRQPPASPEGACGACWCSACTGGDSLQACNRAVSLTLLVTSPCRRRRPASRRSAGARAVGRRRQRRPWRHQQGAWAASRGRQRHDQPGGGGRLQRRAGRHRRAAAGISTAASDACVSGAAEPDWQRRRQRRSGGVCHTSPGCVVSFR